MTPDESEILCLQARIRELERQRDALIEAGAWVYEKARRAAEEHVYAAATLRCLAEVFGEGNERLAFAFRKAKE